MGWGWRIIFVSSLLGGTAHAQSANPPVAGPTGDVSERRAAPPLDDRREVLPYARGQPVPAGWHVETHYRAAEVVAGTLAFTTAYALSLAAGVAAINADRSTFAPLVVPFVGPVIALGRFVDRASEPSDAPDGMIPPVFAIVGVGGLMVLDTLLQIGGAALLVNGLATPGKKLHRDASIGVFRF